MPRSLHGTSSMTEARGRKSFTRHRPTGAHPFKIADVNGSRISFFLINRDDSPVYLGGPNVSVETGVPIAAGGDFEDTESYDEWYAITDNILGDVVVVIVELDR